VSLMTQCNWFVRSQQVLLSTFVLNAKCF